MTNSNNGDRGQGGSPGSKVKPASGSRGKSTSEMPGWTNGLRQLYDQVVDEDLPDTFRDLLARLDDQR